MSPAEQAKQMYESFLPLVQRWDDYKAVSIKKENAKKCALLAIQQIKSVIQEIGDAEIITIWIIFWNRVEEELENI